MELLDLIQQHFREHDLSHDRFGQPVGPELMSATAALLLEAAYGDERFDRVDRKLVLKALKRDFHIGSDEARYLIDRANAMRGEVMKLDAVVDLVARRFTPEQRSAVAELVWRVMADDRQIEPWEETFASYVADRLGLAPEDGEAAKRRALGTRAAPA